MKLSRFFYEEKIMKSIYDFKVKDAKGEDFDLAQLKDKTVLVVNVASKCGFTPQYKGLQKMYSDLKGDGLVILGFPCNQFGAQEPGTNKEIQEFCSLTYNVDFPIMDKVEVNGDDTAPIYAYMKEALPGILGSKKVKWNFTKFLFDKSGKPIKRYASTTKPEDIAKDISKIL